MELWRRARSLARDRRGPRRSQLRPLFLEAEAMVPGRERELAFAWLFLARAGANFAEGRLREALADCFSAESYARTSGDSEAFSAARRLEAVLSARGGGRGES